MTKEYRLQEYSSSGNMAQLLLASAPLFALMVYFLVETYLRSQEPPYTTYNPNNDYVYSIRLMDMLWSFMFVAFLWCLLAFYLVWFVPRRHKLVSTFLSVGVPVLGDVIFLGKKNCMPRHYGKAVYRHTKHNEEDAYPIHIEKTVRIFERYTRENTTILVLPGLLYSGHGKADLEIDNMVIQKNKSKLRFLRYFTLLWVAFLYSAPLYILHVMSLSPDEVDDVQRAWKIYAVCAGLLIPCVSFCIVGASWMWHYHWVTKGDGKLLVERDGAGWEIVRMKYTQTEVSSSPTAQASPKRKGILHMFRTRSNKYDETAVAMSASTTDSSRDLTASPTGDTNYKSMDH